MNTFSWPRPLPGKLRTCPLRSESNPETTQRDWAMLKQFGWLATTAILALLVWQVAAVEPILPRIVGGFLLAIVSLMVGLRIGADSAAAYTKDLQRNNKVLAEQQRDLEEMNEMLLKQVNSDTPAPSKCD